MEFKNTEWEEFQGLFKREELPAKTILLDEGKISNSIFYIEQGCVRAWFNNDGKDITFQFFTETQMVSSIESFKTNRPSQFTIETIEPSIVHSMTKIDFQHVLEQSPVIKEQMEDLIFERLISYQKLFLSRIKDNPETRYIELLKNNPEILLRIPQHYIASYLGITSVSLSRIRNRR
ncbi:cAMP-binding domain of CRP or a regulatory subunit of cAMP-dependent protein kinases [Gillisia sp. Hel1_33_143]|uniref:Crp/Fnr family transcriptional regulator n=1 Tax=Gillisia sp. Hel1_33_143 TaxID=1336796 RepID=UPI00087CC6A8|nr:Crp/Fnr family transcriptional regulator [Gillisia sp. Hel1_33_143]SDR99573.1 cAMP-binding domain of CRP or a regulatory subunit of cAMP-dependent protein kinases [Gillisia sp. Hel1_33_143]